MSTVLFALNIAGCGDSSAVEDSEEVFVIQEKGGHTSDEETSKSDAQNESSEEKDESTHNADDLDDESSVKEEGIDSEGSDSVVKDMDPDVGVWYPYWDYDTATQEMELIGDELDTVCFFAAYFDSGNKAFIPEDTMTTYEALNKDGKLDGKNTYLTFVNDKLLEEGSSLKDTDLLYELFGDEQKASSHADEVISLTRSLGCEGIEIDYEAIKADNTLWGLFNDFVGILTKKAKAQDIPVRIVFEPSAPISDFSWPSYAEYVMMCYNLYGYGTDPGPKADIDFIKDLCDTMNTLPGNVNMAFSSGGFDFADDGNITQIDYREAVSLLESAGAIADRGEASGALFFNYTDDAGVSHEVWYADQETLKIWINTAEDCGINRISIWRLGGNIAE